MTIIDAQLMFQASPKDGAKAMGNGGEINAGHRRSPWRIMGWSLAALILLTPLVAMQFTREVDWTAGDFLFAGLMFGLVGIVYELTVRVSPNYNYRGGVAVALAASFLNVWINGAVGMIGNEDNPYNLLFLGVIGLALIGSVVARFRPRGMAIAMLSAAAAQACVALGGMTVSIRDGIFSAAFALIWLLSAALFRHAARNGG